MYWVAPKYVCLNDKCKQSIQVYIDKKYTNLYQSNLVLWVSKISLKWGLEKTAKYNTLSVSTKHCNYHDSSVLQSGNV